MIYTPEARKNKTCQHPRDSTSETVQWCYSTGRTRDVFGDRYYHLTCSRNGHDLPLLTYLGQGNQADATLSLNAMDDLLNMNRDHQLGLTVNTLSGDRHHDTSSHGHYYTDKNVLTAIPLRENSKDAALP